MPPILEDTRLVFSAAVAFALLLPGPAYALEETIFPALILAMTLTLTQLKIRGLYRKHILYSSIRALIIHYVFLSSFIVALAYAFVSDTQFLYGLIIMAAVPPAVSVVPFTYLLRGDTYTATLAEILSYLLSLAYTPLLAYLLLGDSVDVSYLLNVVAVLILVPFLASRVLAKTGIRGWQHSRSIVTLSFALITYVLVGLNQKLILEDPVSLSAPLLVVFAKTFLAGYLTYRIALGFGAGDKAVPYSLFASFKNNGAAAVIALALFEPKAALPMALSSMIEPAYIMLMQQKKQKV